MELEKFKEIIEILKTKDKNVSQLYDLKIDLMDFCDGYHTIIMHLFREIYGKDGEDWISWFCYENDFGDRGLDANDLDGTKICYDVESLWEYLNKHHTKIT